MIFIIATNGLNEFMFYVAGLHYDHKVEVFHLFKNTSKSKQRVKKRRKKRKPYLLQLQVS